MNEVNTLFGFSGYNLVLDLVRIIASNWTLEDLVNLSSLCKFGIEVSLNLRALLFCDWGHFNSQQELFEWVFSETRECIRMYDPDVHHLMNQKINPFPK